MRSACPSRVPSRFSEVACGLLAGGHAIRFSAPGLSMQPTIRDGETVLVEPVQAGQVHRGDILLYRWERGVRAHRVVAQASACDAADAVFILRGDAGGDDERVLAEKVLGRVVALERDGRRIGLCGAVAWARRALGGSATRIKRRVANRWRLATAAGRWLSRGLFSEEQAVLSTGISPDERERPGSPSPAGGGEFAVREQILVR